MPKNIDEKASTDSSHSGLGQAVSKRKSADTMKYCHLHRNFKSYSLARNSWKLWTRIEWFHKTHGRALKEQHARECFANTWWPSEWWQVVVDSVSGRSMDISWWYEQILCFMLATSMRMSWTQFLMERFPGYMVIDASGVWILMDKASVTLADHHWITTIGKQLSQVSVWYLLKESPWNNQMAHQLIFAGFDCWN